MAAGDFQAQVEGLTSISIGTTPTTAELTEFLRDGVIDVTNRWLAVKAGDIQQFQRVSATIAANGGLNLGGAKIISVLREANADGSSDGSSAWKNCRQISPMLESSVVDPDSLEFASIYNPVYMLADNGEINVYPKPDATDDGYKIYYVNNIPIDQTNGAALTHAHSDIRYFPYDKVYLVVMYAGIRLLQATMGDNVISLTSVPPDVPTLTSVTFSSVDSDVDASLPTYTTATVSAGGVYGSSTAPAYTAPTTTISGVVWATEYPDGEVDLTIPLAAIVTNVDLANSVIDTVPVPPDVPTLSAQSVTITGTAPSYTKPTVQGGSDELTDVTSGTLGSAETDFDEWFHIVGQYIEDQEDVELAGAQLQKINAYISSFSQEMQSAMNVFNDANVEYQATLQKDIQDGQFSDANEARKLQKYQAELSGYQAEIGAMTAQAQGYLNTAQGYAGEINTRLSITQAKISEYQARAQDSLQEFNEDNAAFQANIQEAMQEIQVANQVNIAAAQGELQLNMDNENRSQQRQLQNSINDMQAIIANNDDLMGKFAAETTGYQAEVGTEVQEKTAKMQQYKVLHDQLLLEYNAAFGVTGAEA